MGLFGPSKQEISWSEFAQDIGGVYIKGGFWGTNKVLADIGPWTMVLDTYTVSTGKSSVTYTRFVIPFNIIEPFKFKIYNQGFFSQIGKLLGMEDIEIGDQEFDDKFIIKGNNKDRVIQLFSHEGVKAHMLQGNKISLEIKEKGKILDKKLQPDQYMLYFQQTGVITDKNRLNQLGLLFAQVLKALAQMEVIATDKIIDINNYK